MDKNADKKFAVWARRELIRAVSEQAAKLGISADSPAEPPADATPALRSLCAHIRSKGYEQVMEDAAGTWFTRFCALRYMEVNGYLPHGEGIFAALAFPRKAIEAQEAAFSRRIIALCRELSRPLPGMFRAAEHIGLLFPTPQLCEGSVLQRLLTGIPATDWQGGVQLIGWLYQHYNSEKKDAVFAALKKNIKITKSTIPAATQLFTPDWIVRYMVENTLGRLWADSHPHSPLKTCWRYYLDEPEQPPAVQAQQAALRAESTALPPESITCIDPCCGSGHILAYMFDVLVQIYTERGYSTPAAVHSIVEHNLYGLDIDPRAARLAYFTVMMKARQYDPAFLTAPQRPRPKVYTVAALPTDPQLLRSFAGDDPALHQALQTMRHELQDAKEFGSLLRCTSLDFASLYARAESLRHGTADQAAARRALLPCIRVAHALSRQYDVVVTNPPYMGTAGMSPKLSRFVKAEYPDSKADLFAVFIERCEALLRPRRHMAMLTQLSWMFLSSYENLRRRLLQNQLLNMAYLKAHAFDEIPGEVVQTTAFVLRKGSVPGYRSLFCHLEAPTTQAGKEELFLSGRQRYTVPQDSFAALPGCPLAFWLSPRMQGVFRHPPLSLTGSPRQGMATGCNARFTRLWHEVDIRHTMLCAPSRAAAQESARRWFPYNKGGDFRKWYGNNDWLVDWEQDGARIRAYSGSVVRNAACYFKPCITWSKIATTDIAFRFKPAGHLFDVAGTGIYADDTDSLLLLAAFGNSKVAMAILRATSPTINYEVGQVAAIPCHPGIFRCSQALPLVRQNIELCRADWDCFEPSWDFARHPLLRGLPTLEAAYLDWAQEADARFCRLKANEEALNRIFIDLYGLQDELSPTVDDKDISVRRADLGRDIRSLISYAVGCIFGRFSLSAPGLAYAGGPWQPADFAPLSPVEDNIMVLGDDASADNDILPLFERFLVAAFGADSLEDNLRFIASALGDNGSPRELIRKYFRDSFYADHLKTYQKRPLYWLFSSGKKGSFRALMYLHRYSPATITRLASHHVPAQLRRLRSALKAISRRLPKASPTDSPLLAKQQKKLQARLTELLAYHHALRSLPPTPLDLNNGIPHNYALLGNVLGKIG